MRFKIESIELTPLHVPFKDYVIKVMSGLNSERPGGVIKAIKAFNYAKMRGLGVVLHNQPLGIASAMHIHFAAPKFPWIDYATELFGQEMLVDDLISKPIVMYFIAFI